MGITKDLAQYLVESSYSDFPPETIELTKGLLLKTITGMVVGAQEPISKRVRRYLAQAGGSPEAGVVMSGFRTTVENAAMAHGVFAHSSELEDCQVPGVVGTFWIWPALFPLAEKLLSDGREIITAAASSWEITARLALASDPTTYARGVLPNTFYGTIGAAAAAAKLLHLSVEEMANALSIAASFSSGLVYQTGTDAHVLESGHTCRSGVLASLLARDGATGQADIFERKYGLLEIAGASIDQANLAKITKGLGKPPFNVHKIWVKKYPCCWANHTPIDALKMLMQEHKFSYDAVKQVEIEVSQGDCGLCDRQPDTLGNTRFSFYHVLGEVLLRGNVGLDTFTLQEKLTEPALAEARKKIKVICSTRYAPAVMQGARVTVFGKGGKSFTKELKQSIGGPDTPLTGEQMVSLCKQYLEGVLDNGLQERLIGSVNNLEKQGDICGLMQMLSRTNGAG